MELNLLDKMLEHYQGEQTSVTITLSNKIQIHGTIKAFDSYVVMMESKRNEILFRHAMSSLAPYAPEEAKRPSPEKPVPIKSSAKSRKRPPKKPRQEQPASRVVAADADQSINSGMKDELMKWMQEQKAAK